MKLGSLLLLAFGAVVHLALAENLIGDSGKLIFASVLYRHGDRAPITTYPNDPYVGPAFWDDNWAQLSNIGKHDHYNLGRWLKRRYNNLLSNDYYENEISIEATTYDRTIESALSNLAGMYPPTGKSVWNINVEWQPIAVRTTPSEYDYLMGEPIPKCAAYEEATAEFYETQKYQSLMEESQPLFDYLTKHTGQNVTTIREATLIRDNLHYNKRRHHRLPGWAKSVYPGGQLEKLVRFLYNQPSCTPALARFRSGFLLRQILERSGAKSNGTLVPDRSVNVYSGHGSTVANMLTILGMFHENSPPAPDTSVILIEARSHCNITYIEVYFKNSTDQPAAKYIPNCGYSCPLDQMYQVFKEVLPTADFATECKSTKSVFTKIGDAVKKWF